MGSSLGRVYVDFDPAYEFIQREEEDIFVVNLTGFEQKQLTVQVKRDRKVAISGERPLPDNRWSRFRKEFPVAARYNTQEIAAKFGAGLLYLVLPKSPQIPDREHHHPRPQIPTQKQPDPQPAHLGSKTEPPPKQSIEDKKREDSSSIEKDYQPSKKRPEEGKKSSTEEEPLIKKDHSYDLIKKDPRDGRDTIGEEDRWLVAALPAAAYGKNRVQLENLKLKMGSMELELHRTNQLVKGLVVVIAVFLGIGFYLHYKLISSSSSNRGERQQ